MTNLFRKNLLLTFFLFFSFGSMMLLSAQNDLANGEKKEKMAEKAAEIINKYIEALGGKTNLEKISSLVIRGKGQSGFYTKSLPIVKYVKNPGKNKTEISLMNQKMVTATNGDISWEINPFYGNGQPRQMPELAEEFKIKESDNKNDVLYTIGKNLINYKERGYEAEYMGKTNFRGKKAHHIRLTSDVSEDDYYIDALSYLLLMAKVDFSKNYYDDYKKVGNITFPHKMEEGGGYREMKIEVDEVLINDDIDDKVFEMPFTQFNIEEDVFLNEKIEDETFDFSDENLTAEVIVNDYLKLTGSVPLLDAKKSIIMKGKMTIGSIDMPFQMYAKKNNKFRMEMSFMGETSIMATNGKKSWEKDPFRGKKVAEEVPHEELSQNMNMFEFQSELTTYKGSAGYLDYLGKTKVRGVEAHVLKLEPNNHVNPDLVLSKEILYFFDVEKHLLLMKFNKTDGTREYYTEYKKIDDLYLPHYIETFNNVEYVSMKLNIDEIILGEKFKDDIFSMPK